MSEISNELSQEAKDWLQKETDRNNKIEEWKSLNKYSYNKNIDIINDTLHNCLKENIKLWYDEHQGFGIIDKDKIIEIVSNITYDLMNSDVVELKTEVQYLPQALSGNKEYCVAIYYKFRMDEEYALTKSWIFGLSDIIRGSKMDWLFD